MGGGHSTDNSGSGNTNCGNTNTGNIGGSNIGSLPAQNIPWREVDWSDSALAELVTRVKTFKPKGASQLRVLLYGPAGSGKSAFVDSVAGAVDGQSVTLTEAGGTAFTSHTLKLKGDKDTKIPVVFNDVTWLSEDGRGVGAEDVRLILKGHVKDNYMFNPVKALQQCDDFYRKDPCVDHKVHVVVCFLDAKSANANDSTVLQKLKEMMDAATDLGIPHVAIVSHIDHISAQIQDDIKKVFCSQDFQTEVNGKVQCRSGIPPNNIFPVWNHYAGAQEQEAHILLLEAFGSMLSLGDDFLTV
ncbi:hypothetical protein WMY93_028138 [Mugilogobius chulae]|uniref:G domain-containing protein n=1 Tax=Mugilogobius chulae TaxID=88201 RepID=A0AAW0MYG0_9GOBI